MVVAAVAGAPLQASSSRAVPLLQRSVLQMHVVFLEPNSSESVHPSSTADKKVHCAILDCLLFGIK